MKNYTTPIFVPIRLEETTMAKGSCKIDSTQAELMCVVYDEDMRVNIFSTSNDGCESNDASKVCYHVPTADTSIFSS